MSQRIEQAADQLHRAATNGVTCEPIRSLLPTGDVAAAYAVQDINIRRAEAAGRRIVGRKIGLTAKAVQRQLGVDQPDYGFLFSDMAVADGDMLPWRQVQQPKAEAEIALLLGRDLPYEDTTPAELAAAVEYVLPAIEIVGSRITNWDIQIVDTIADNASSGAYVLGNSPRKLVGLDLKLCGMVMFDGTEPVSIGAGAACLGHPLNAAAWLARTMAAAGRPLRAGETILTGALGPMVPVRSGAVLQAHIEGLGSVSFAMGADGAP